MKHTVKKIAEKTLKGPLYNKAVLPKHLGVAVAANLKRGFPARGLTVIGVTGTNGKTSTSFLIHSVLCEAGMKAGLLTTVAWGVGKDLQPQIHHMTSQPIGLLLERITKMRQQGMEILVLEVTSHALAQFRTLGVPISVAVMTNVTHEHLDYHGSFSAYRAAKLKLFKHAADYKSGKRLGVVNADDPSAAMFADAVPNVLAYSLTPSEDPAVLWPRNLKSTPDGSSYNLEVSLPESGTNKLKIECRLPGSFNVANSLAAVAVGLGLQLPLRAIEKGIAGLQSVEGRMTNLDEGQPFSVIVDFAHTPDSFEKLFTDIRPMVKGRLISLFGSAGRRDVSKRAIQGRIAGEFSDVVVVTEEDDRDIDGNKILDQIAAGAQKAGKTLDKDLFKILDRTKAIEFALSQARPGDTVLLLGKGHEKTIERADGEHVWDEEATARKILKKLKSRGKAG